MAGENYGVELIRLPSSIISKNLTGSNLGSCFMMLVEDRGIGCTESILTSSVIYAKILPSMRLAEMGIGKERKKPGTPSISEVLLVS